MSLGSRKKTEAKQVATQSTSRRKPGAAYFDLVNEFPLRLIETERELDQAIAILDELMDKNQRGERTKDEEEYMLALSVFVEEYEEKHYPMGHATGVEMLEFVIENRGLKQTDVAAGAGIPESTLSGILRGRRKLNTKHIAALAGFFNLDPGLFLDADKT
jgi:HTH-type transcriptional regulator/antitoxin HigA